MGHPVSGYMLIGMTALITVAIAIWDEAWAKVSGPAAIWIISIIPEYF